MRVLRSLWDGPIRSRMFWIAVVSGAVKAAAWANATFGWALDVMQYEDHALQIIGLLGFIGILDATRGVTPVDDLDKAWSLKTLERRQDAREAAEGAN